MRQTSNPPELTDEILADLSGGTTGAPVAETPAAADFQRKGKPGRGVIL